MRQMRAVAALALVSLAGCGGPLILRLEGADKLNQNQKTPPENIPVTVLIFLLKDKGSFTNASVEQLWTKEKAKAVLGADQVGEARERTVNASDKGIKVDLGQMPPDVRFIGLVAKLPKQDPPVQRHIAVPKDEADDVVFELVEYRLDVKK